MAEQDLTIQRSKGNCLDVLSKTPDVEPRYDALSQNKELKCGDCENLTSDMGCWGCLPEDSAVKNGKLCKGFRTKKCVQ
ncbi:hypothetical protein [Oribacterium sp. WCC10]|uniref:hypothetical protein n=1 Tax=Oribacterium sp. WCC10 TaxID=1855343 RepID=UPI000B897F0C|nr:hypothetical protein [Oribacterium sp. WCC10]